MLSSILMSSRKFKTMRKLFGKQGDIIEYVLSLNKNQTFSMRELQRQGGHSWDYSRKILRRLLRLDIIKKVKVGTSMCFGKEKETYEYARAKSDFNPVLCKLMDILKKDH